MLCFIHGYSIPFLGLPQDLCDTEIIKLSRFVSKLVSIVHILLDLMTWMFQFIWVRVKIMFMQDNRNDYRLPKSLTVVFSDYSSDNNDFDFTTRVRFLYSFWRQNMCHNGWFRFLSPKLRS
ncbi:hypothetical protein ISN45_Aa05g011450 [Arabidopsis thaliana x Arabidopsis arenosa]|uniref:Uncharacterized protein n=1 Tax=Arabidopsis thaliana x Arabidopsis arenosa TaxID=1240361 RepID=A0A8T1ZJK1_9BRAS|nr:hypothetical protein ISN45_Aa05g011450 [Arabidopsis thaliana x Arabidopsis arenosa]